MHRHSLIIFAFVSKSCTICFSHHNFFVPPPFSRPLVPALSYSCVRACVHVQADRQDILNRLRAGRLGLVVTTELAARGLDAPLLSHAFNLDLPTDAAHYAHRAGRVGRAGRAGVVVSLATPQTAFVVRRFARQLQAPLHDLRVYANQLEIVSTASPVAAPAPSAAS